MKSTGIILQYVRGEEPIAALESLGITFIATSTGYECDNPRHEMALVELSDIAQGLLVHHKDSAALQVWARIVMSAPTIFDLSKCESDTGGELLLTALWDAAFTGSITDSALHMAEELTRTELPPLR